MSDSYIFVYEYGGGDDDEKYKRLFSNKSCYKLKAIKIPCKFGEKYPHGERKNKNRG